MIRCIERAWSYALRRRPNVRVALIDPDDGTSLVLDPNAAKVIQAALRALADREKRDPMAMATLSAEASGTIAPGPKTVQ